MPAQKMVPATYDPDEVIIQVDGLDVYGFAEGSMVSVERSQDFFNNYIGTRGEVTRARIRDATGTVTMRLQHTSPFIEVFREYITADATNGVPPIVSITVKDPSSYEQLFATYAWLNNEGTREWGNEATEREYVFFAVDTEDGPNSAITSIDQYLA